MLYLGYLFAGLVVVGALWLEMFGRPMVTPTCTTRIVETQRALLASDKDLAALQVTAQQATCQVYRQRVAVLKEVVPVFTMCGSPQSTPTGTAPERHVELAFYENLVAQKCDKP
jgi:hypothetical protein